MEKPRLLKSLAAIPDSDDDEDEELPDSPRVEECVVQAPDPSRSAAKDSQIHAVPPQEVVIKKKMLEAEEVIAATSRNPAGKQGEKYTPVTSGPSSPLADILTMQKKDNSSSPPAVNIEMESSPATNFPFPSPARIKVNPFQAKRKESPSISFTAPEVSQNKDVLMAELKAMKIVSPFQLASFWMSWTPNCSSTSVSSSTAACCGRLSLSLSLFIPSQLLRRFTLVEKSFS